jgi:signal transduction histidine kinase
LAEEDVFASGLPQYNIEESSIDVSGNQRWFSVTRVPLKGPQGKVTGLVGIKHDITSRKRAEQTLHETQDQLIQAARFESIGTLASGVAHEVKNPLQTILMGVSFLSRKLQNPDESISKSLKDMEESVSRADSIISELLALSRVSEFQLERGDLNPIIRQSLRLINCKLDAAGVAVVLHLAADLPRPLLNVFKLEQVFIILFLNAIHAMPSGGTLTVTTRVAVLDQALAAIGPMFQKFQAGQRLVVGEVRDTGTGIPDWAQKRLFEPFFTTKPAGVGTGLGLFVARRIVERHSGAIALQNTPDGGALATVALKLDPED